MSADTRTVIERLKKHYGVTTAAEVLRAALAHGKRTRDGLEISLAVPDPAPSSTDAEQRESDAAFVVRMNTPHSDDNTHGYFQDIANDRIIKDVDHDRLIALAFKGARTAVAPKGMPEQRVLDEQLRQEETWARSAEQKGTATYEQKVILDLIDARASFAGYAGAMEVVEGLRKVATNKRDAIDSEKDLPRWQYWSGASAQLTEALIALRAAAEKGGAR